MKIAVLAHGSRGDVQPPLALAHHLVARGHEVSLVLPANFTAVAAQLGARVVSLGSDPRVVLSEGRLLSTLREGRTLRFFQQAFELERLRYGAMLEAIQAGCEGAELIVIPPLLEDLALCVAEAGQQRVAFAFPMPVWANASYPSIFVSTRALPGWLCHLSHALAELGMRPLLALINQARERLGLARARRRPSVLFRRAAPPVFYWVPPEVLPPARDLGPNHRYTGYWGVPPLVRAALGESAPPPELEAFLSAGEAPIFFGLGSMPLVDEGVVALVRSAAAGVERRVVLGRGWSATPNQRGAQLLTVSDVDHDWLLPRCVVAVHHGGASTTGAALRAGIPAVVTPVFADQPFWGRRVAALGTGESLSFQRLTSARLEAALRRVLAAPVRERARALGASLRGQRDGAEEAARVIHEEGLSFPVPGRLG